MNVSLVVNPVAGNRAYKYIDGLRDILEKRVKLTSFITRKKGDARDFAKNITGADRILIASGDGTINEVINGLLSGGEGTQNHIPIGLIPLGLTNVLAKELGIPERVEDAVERALTGKPEKISLGRINGRYFSLMAGAGYDGETVMGLREDFLKKISGKLAHIVSGMRVLKNYNPAPVRVRTADADLTCYTAVIGNARCYGGFYYVTPGASLTDPVLDICALRNRTRRGLIRYIYGVIRHRHLTYNDVAYLRTNEVELTSPGTVHVQIDGDYFGTLPARIDVVKDAVSLIW